MFVKNILFPIFLNNLINYPCPLRLVTFRGGLNTYMILKYITSSLKNGCFQMLLSTLLYVSPNSTLHSTLLSSVTNAFFLFGNFTNLTCSQLYLQTWFSFVSIKISISFSCIKSKILTIYQYLKFQINEKRSICSR